MKKPNIVIAGDVVFAGIDEDDRSECKIAVVIEFDSAEQMREAFKSKSVEFTIFE